MRNLLLAIKILGIVLSAVSLIGNRRLIALEKRIREAIDWEKLKRIRLSVHDGPLMLGCISCIIIPIISVGIPVFLWFRLEQVIQTCITYFELESITLPGMESWVGNTFSFIIPMATKHFSYDQVIHFLLWLIMALIWWFSSIIVVNIMISYTILLYYVIYILVFLFSVIVWLVTRPYIWLDSFIQQKNWESTLIALGVIMAIVSEVLDRFYFD